MLRPYLIPAVLTLFLAGCATGRAHQNFKDAMARNLGLHENDPAASINYYRRNVASRYELPNGNTEVEYRAGRWSENDQCHAYFEIDKTSRVITRWRYEGSESACAIVP
jgi:hypothetical protein